MSIQRVFSERPSELSKGGLYFENIEGYVDLQEGVIAAEAVKMKSPVFNAMAWGKADLNTKMMDAELAIQPLGSMDAVVSRVPIVGYLLTGEKKAVYVDYFEVKGPFSAPEVAYIPLKSLGNTTLGFIRRLFLGPGHLFRSMKDAARDFEREGVPVPDEEFRPEDSMGP
jgi:hypothetical protein